MNENVFGTELRRLRKTAGFGLNEMAAKVGISNAYLSDIELGRRLPGDEVLFTLASAIGHGAQSTALRDQVIDARISVLKERIAELEKGKVSKQAVAKPAKRARFQQAYKTTETRSKR